MGKKIGQVTYWNNNYGSILQCYATQKIIEDLGYEPVLLIRKEKGFRRKTQGLGFRIKKYLMYIKYFKYRKIFDEILSAYNRVSTSGLLDENKKMMNKFIDNEINLIKTSYKELRKIAKSKEYKAFISGSDQIWSGSWFIVNPMWFLRFAPNRKKISWAVSFGTDELAKYNEKIYKKYINDYRYISVRELSGKNIIRNLIGKNVQQVLDPTLLLSKEQWEKKLSTKLLIKEKYICLFFLDKPDENVIKYLKLLQINFSCVVYAFGYWYDSFKEIPLCKCMVGGPEEFLYIIKNAELICTDSFHGTAFSINFKKNFLAFKRKYNHSHDQSTRLISILEKCDLKSKFVDKLDYKKIDISYPDFTVAEDVLKYEREKGIEFLNNSIGKI